MKVELIKTKEQDGDWFKVLIDDKTKVCIGFGKHNVTEEDAAKRAAEIYDFFIKNKGEFEVIKSETI